MGCARNEMKGKEVSNLIFGKMRIFREIRRESLNRNIIALGVKFMRKKLCK